MNVIDLFVNQMPLLLVVIGVLVILTNVIVEVLKKFTYEKIPTNILAVVVALALTIVAFFALLAYLAIPFVWYYLAAAVVLAMLVAYAAMFGFEKLKEALFEIQKLKA